MNGRLVSVNLMSAVLILTLTPTMLRAEQIRCDDSKDAWISSQPREADASAGKADRIKLKVLQEMGLIGFDVARLQGRKIVSAELHIQPVPDNAPKFVEDRPTNLRWIVVSTVSSHWVEGSQQRPAPDPEGHGATYRQASFDREPWAWQGSTLSDVINGHLNSIYSVGELVPAEEGYWKVPIDAKVVQALVAGLGDGVLVMDGSSTHQNNPFIFTREAKGKAPYLLVTVEGDQATRPAAPQVISVEPDLQHANLDTGALQIRVKTPRDALGFHVKIDGQRMEPWQVELPRDPDGSDVITLEDLPPGKEVKVTIAAVDTAGNISDWTEATGKVSDKVTVPELARSPFEPQPGDPKKAGSNLLVWAFPEIVEVDPVTALPMFEKNKEAYRRANPVWSGAGGQIRLAAARGEIVAFQLALEQQGQPVTAQVSVEATAPNGQKLPSQNINLYRVWYVPSGPGHEPVQTPAQRQRQQRQQSRAGRNAAQTRPAASAPTQPAEERWNPEYVVPIQAGKIQVPMPDNKIPNQKLQAVYVDLVIPPNAQAGTHTGQVRIRADGGEVVLPLELVVYPVRIPAELTFNPELNTYNGPAAAGTKAFFDWHRLAHYNRCTLNRVPYSQTGDVNEDMVPKITGKGANTRVADWTQYDRNVGPLLDGSAFKGLPRDGVPVKTFYLPIFENWPMRLEGHYEMGMPARAQGRANDEDARREALQLKEKHDLTVKPIDQAFDRAYKDGFRNVTGQFVKHFDQKGWTRPLYEMYQNNKYHYRGQWWILDEPTEWTDWNALAFFARLFHEGMDFPHEAQFLYRGDISRPQWQAGFMDGLMDILYSGSNEGLGNPRLMMHIKDRTGMILYVYGSGNAVERNSFESAAWCLKAFSVGADGVLPWQSVGQDRTLDQPTQTALLVTGNRFNTTAVASLRVLALRHGAQQCELLRQVLDRNPGWNRWHAYALATRRVPLKAMVNPRFADEAAAATFEQMTAENFLQLKEGLLQMLSHEPARAPADRRQAAR